MRIAFGYAYPAVGGHVEKMLLVSAWPDESQAVDMGCRSQAQMKCGAVAGAKTETALADGVDLAISGKGSDPGANSVAVGVGADEFYL